MAAARQLAAGIRLLPGFVTADEHGQLRRQMLALSRSVAAAAAAQSGGGSVHPTVPCAGRAVRMPSGSPWSGVVCHFAAAPTRRTLSFLSPPMPGLVVNLLPRLKMLLHDPDFSAALDDDPWRAGIVRAATPYQQIDWKFRLTHECPPGGGDLCTANVAGAEPAVVTGGDAVLFGSISLTLLFGPAVNQLELIRLNDMALGTGAVDSLGGRRSQLLETMEPRSLCAVYGAPNHACHRTPRVSFSRVTFVV